MKIRIVHVENSSKSCFSKKCWGKWYGSIALEFKGEIYHRYISPKGWSKNAHYFDTKDEINAAIAQFGPCDLPVSRDEENDRSWLNETFEETGDGFIRI